MPMLVSIYGYGNVVRMFLLSRIMAGPATTSATRASPCPSVPVRAMRVGAAVSSGHSAVSAGFSMRWAAGDTTIAPKTRTRQQAAWL